MDTKTKKHEFWFENMGEYERKILRKAGFSEPEDFYDIQLVSLVSLNRFGFQCASTLIEAIMMYKGGFEEDEIRTAKEFDFFYEDEEIPDDDCELMNIDFALMDSGFDNDEKTVRMTVRQFSELHIAYCAPAFDEIIKKYYQLYCPPVGVSNFTGEDLIKNAEMMFTNPRG